MKSLFKGLLFFLILAGPAVWANDQHNFPEGTLLALEGQDAISKKPCFLYVTEVGFTGPEQTADQWFATILTSYNHGGASAGAIKVIVHPTRVGTVFGTASNGQDQIAVFLNPQNHDLRTAKSFNLKWFHIDHFHTNRCNNLKVHED